MLPRLTELVVLLLRLLLTSCGAAETNIAFLLILFFPTFFPPKHIITFRSVDEY